MTSAISLVRADTSAPRAGTLNAGSVGKFCRVVDFTPPGWAESPMGIANTDVTANTMRNERFTTTPAGRGCARHSWVERGGGPYADAIVSNSSQRAIIAGMADSSAATRLRTVLRAAGSRTTAGSARET